MGVRVSIPVSVGEALDRLCILDLKWLHIGCNIQSEYDEIANVLGDLGVFASDAVGDLDMKLYTVNKSLWDAEDAIRAKEAKQEFDDEFIQLARSIYKMNDERAVIKRCINEETGSEIVEVKKYVEY